MKALVTGGGGFLGSRIAQMLHARGDEVIVLGRRRYAHHDKAGIPTLQADIRDAEAVARACAGMDVVFHVAALTGIWGRRKAFWDVNVTGTKHVIAGCRKHNVGRLIYTSSPSVVFGTDDLCGVDESQPYPERYLADYPETKAHAERSILEANGPDLATVALRPHLVVGPGDPHLIPRVIDRARRGRLVQVGEGRNLVDITYIDDAAEAHLQAADALGTNGSCAGRAYFLSQGDPVPLWPWLNRILAAVGAPRAKRSISFQMAYRIGAFFERMYRMFGIDREPPLTRFVSSQLAKSHYFNISAARRDFGYRPGITVKEITIRLVAWIHDRNAPTPEERVTVPRRIASGGQIADA